MSIAENIKFLRKHYNMTQNEFGKIAGVSDKAVSTWEKGTKEPRMGAIQKIADHFGLLKSEIIEEKGIVNHFSVSSVSSVSPCCDNEKWTNEELAEIERFKQFVLAKRMDNK